MYFLSEDGLAQLWPERGDWPLPPIIFPRGGGKTLTEEERIDDEIKRGTSVNDLTNKLFWDRHPELRDCRLPRSCRELERLQREWSLMRARVAAKIDQAGRKHAPKPR